MYIFVTELYGNVAGTYSFFSNTTVIIAPNNTGYKLFKLLNYINHSLSTSIIPVTYSTFTSTNGIS